MHILLCFLAMRKALTTVFKAPHFGKCEFTYGYDIVCPPVRLSTLHSLCKSFVQTDFTEEFQIFCMGNISNAGKNYRFEGYLVNGQCHDELFVFIPTPHYKVGHIDLHTSVRTNVRSSVQTYCVPTLPTLIKD